MVTDKFKVKQGITTTSATTATPAYDLVPTGTIAMWVSATAPDGWLLCDGTGFSNATYPDLATVVGDTYGTHSGSTYYQPNIKGRTVIGVGTGTGLTARTLGTAGGAETVAITDNIVSHLHTLGNHAHNLGSHVHDSNHYFITGQANSQMHTYTHSHTGGNHSHTGGSSSNAHQHNSYFGLTTGSGTARARNQTTSGSLNSTHVYAAGGHTHTMSQFAGTATFGYATPTFTSTAAGTTAGGGTTSGPSTNSTATYTGASTSISIMQKSYVLTYIIKT